MKTRVATAIVLCAGMLALFFFLPPVCAVIVFGVFCAIGAWELLFVTKSVPKHAFLFFSCAYAFAIPFISVFLSTETMFAAIFVYTAAAMSFGVFCHKKIGFSAVAKGVLASVALPLMLSSVLRILNDPLGLGPILVMAPWLTVWVCDSAALFVGKALGKRKLAPYVSPKKTVAGFLGGLTGGVIAMVVYSWFIGMMSFEVPSLLLFSIYGFVGAAAGQIGDLALSVIKREAGIKDYSRLFPGHGGVWDRFDSIIFAAPVFEILFLNVLPIISS